MPARRAEADRRVLAAYAIPFTGGALVLFTVQLFFLKYATDVLLLSPIVLGGAFGLSKLVDAVTDPLVGAWSDRTNVSLGRRRPWMLASALPVAVTFFAIWNPPQADLEATTVWVCVFVVLFYVSFTGYNIPHFALGAELSPSSHARTRLYGARQGAEIVGMLVAFLVMQSVSNAADARAQALGLTALIATVAGLSLLGTPVLLREPAHRGRGGAGLRSALIDVWRNPQGPRLMLGWWFAFLAMSAMGVMGPYAAEYVLGRPDLIAALPGSFVVASLVSIPLWVRLAGRFGKTRCWIWSLLGVSLALGSLLLGDVGNVGWFFAATAGAGACVGGSTVLGPALLADAVDHDERLTGERKEGVYSSIFGLVGKSGAAFVTALTGVFLSWSGYTPNEIPDPSVRTALLHIFVGVPVVASLLSALVLRDLRGGPLPVAETA
jgi:GPH family glycoside/pentoside/hexuronide:cation symporter